MFNWNAKRLSPKTNARKEIPSPYFNSVCAAPIRQARFALRVKLEAAASRASLGGPAYLELRDLALNQYFGDLRSAIGLHEPFRVYRKFERMCLSPDERLVSEDLTHGRDDCGIPWVGIQRFTPGIAPHTERQPSARLWEFLRQTKHLPAD